ncbi:alpha/beta hydrolase family protein [Steroidobacter sp.]|uniref:alpha/beta hydrolase family protein n=1 Tax=Steroidobacter sp. TaxID=1978227 RepID=UPI001A59D368|nr:prolyl oligopeptidase family serine peptidase [Steroidobacter sp.]MBL8267709.1 S9 family peptidase [Steroidobacter sp.]
MRNLIWAALALPVLSCASTLPPGFDFRLAFDPIEVPAYDRLALTDDGARLAFTLQKRPDVMPPEQPFDPFATMTFYYGAKVRLVDLTARGEAATPKAPCADGNSWSPAWSHDNRQLAFYSDAGGKPGVWIYDGKSCRAVGSLPTNGMLGDPPIWSADDRTLYVVGPGGNVKAKPASDATSDQPSVKVFQSGNQASAAAKAEKLAFIPEKFFIGAVDVASGVSKILVPAEGDASPTSARISTSGRWMTYLSQTTQPTSQAEFTKELWALRLPDGKPVRLVNEVPELWGDAYRLTYRWHPEQDKLVYWKDGAVYLIEFGADGPQPARRVAADLGRLESTVYWFTRDGRLIVGTDPINPQKSGRSDITPRGLAVLSLDSGAPVRWQFAAGQEFLSLLTVGDSTIWQHEPNLITAQLRDKASGKRSIVRFDMRTGREETLWQGYGKRGENVAASADHKLWLDLNQDLQTADNIAFYSERYVAKRPALVLDPRLAGVKVGSAQTFDTPIPTYAGAIENVRTTVLLPPGAKRGDKLPAVVMVYPGADLSNRVESFGGGSGNTTPSILYTSRGFAVVMPFVKLGPEKQQNDVAKQLVDELLPQVLRAAELGYIDSSRLAVSGQSYGGYSTAMLASQTNLFRAGIAVNGAFDLGGSYAAMNDKGFAINVGWSENSQGRLGVPVWTNPLRYLDNSPYYRADRIFTPLLLVSGEGDTRVPSEESKRLFVALRRLDKTAELALYAGQGHVISDWSPAQAVDASQRILQFLQKYLVGI